MVYASVLRSVSSAVPVQPRVPFGERQSGNTVAACIVDSRPDGAGLPL